jgi:tubulin--tyrosine ligase
MAFTAFVSFPDAEFTENLVVGALNKLEHKPIIISELIEPEPLPLLQWSTYDEISHPLTLTKPRSVLSSTYVIRKSLIRKHFLHRSVQEYIAKHAESILKRSVPPTWDIEVQWADELDEMWSDELYELSISLPETSGDIEDDEAAKWYILKPGMADRGMGIRMFRSKQGLRTILERFEAGEDEGDQEEIEDENGDKTTIVASQLRHFVIQVCTIYCSEVLFHLNIV